ncbi:MAG: protein kinase, partial [Acidobacteriota bacterium]|nr:protein kinase [Acidobacteriota bacterium]
MRSRIGPYEVLGHLGAGGMGEVYRARDPRLGREVAVKVLPAESRQDRDRLKRFVSEAKAASALNHPNILTVHDIGEDENGPYMVTELVSGRTLRAMIEEGPIPASRAVDLMAQTLDGIAKAHEAGIVHRDLKPENLMVTRDGFVKILDFGLAKLVPAGFESSGGTNLPTMTRGTEAGTVLGTVGYMSPEQASGQLADFRSDQFSFGAILYEMAAGKRAFERPTPVQTLSAVIQEEPEPLGVIAPKTPTDLVGLVERCLAKDPDERYGSTKDLARDLAAMRDHPSGISTSTAAQPAARRYRPSRALLGAVALAGIAAAGLSFWVGQTIQASRDRRTPRPARQKLTFRRGFINGARFAPDGQTIVYSASWDGKPSEIFTTRVGSSESRPLGIFPAGVLSISSTGEMAVSLGCEILWEPCFGTLARVPLAGGAPREVLEDVGSADWSPDGKELAAIHVVEGRYRLEYPIGKVLYKTEGFLSRLRVSPNGKLVAFLEHPHRDSERGTVCVVDRAGHARTLTREWTQVSRTLWSPTGNEIFFGGILTGKGWEIKAVRLSGGVRDAPWIPAMDDVSRDGLFLDAGSHASVRRDILALVPGALKERGFSWQGEDQAADLSGDGRKMLFYEPDWNQNIFVTYVRKTDGSDPKMLGVGKALALSPDEQWALVAQPLPEPH